MRHIEEFGSRKAEVGRLKSEKKTSNCAFEKRKINCDLGIERAVEGTKGLPVYMVD
jgi:hypothetical protein